MDIQTSAQISNVYQQFRTAYSALNADGIASTYAEQGVEVYLNAGVPPTFVYGRDAIRDGILKFFNRVRERGHRLKVDFRIVNRELHGEQAFDTGFFELTILDGEAVFRTRYGKVAIVLQRNLEGAWEYLYDGNSDATQEEYEKAVPIENGEIV